MGIEPDNADYRYSLGILLGPSGNLGQSITQLEAAVRLSPGMGVGHQNLGTAYFLSGRLQEAEEHYLKALKLMPEEPSTHYNLMMLYQSLGDEQQAAIHDAAFKKMRKSPEG